MLVSDSPPAWRTPVLYHNSISLFINLEWVVINCICGAERAHKGHSCFFYLFIFPTDPPFSSLNLCLGQKIIHPHHDFLFLFFWANIHLSSCGAEKSSTSVPLLVVFDRNWRLVAKICLEHSHDINIFVFNSCFILKIRALSNPWTGLCFCLMSHKTEWHHNRRWSDVSLQPLTFAVSG